MFLKFIIFIWFIFFARGWLPVLYISTCWFFPTKTNITNSLEMKLCLYNVFWWVSFPLKLVMWSHQEYEAPSYICKFGRNFFHVKSNRNSERLLSKQGQMILNFLLKFGKFNREFPNWFLEEKTMEQKSLVRNFGKFAWVCHARLVSFPDIPETFFPLATGKFRKFKQGSLVEGKALSAWSISNTRIWLVL